MSTCVFLGRLTWLVYIIGAAVGGRVSFNSNDEHDAMDGELVCRVLQLMNLTDARLSQVCPEDCMSFYTGMNRILMMLFGAFR